MYAYIECNSQVKKYISYFLSDKAISSKIDRIERMVRRYVVIIVVVGETYTNISSWLSAVWSSSVEWGKVMEIKVTSFIY